MLGRKCCKLSRTVSGRLPQSGKRRAGACGGDTLTPSGRPGPAPALAPGGQSRSQVAPCTEQLCVDWRGCGRCCVSTAHPNASTRAHTHHVHLLFQTREAVAVLVQFQRTQMPENRKQSASVLLLRHVPLLLRKDRQGPRSVTHGSEEGRGWRLRRFPVPDTVHTVFPWSLMIVPYLETEAPAVTWLVQVTKLMFLFICVDFNKQMFT